MYARPLAVCRMRAPQPRAPTLPPPQVCRHWRQALEGPAALQLWEELVVDVGHELVTAVHVPVAWSDVRPSDEEFRAAFAAVRLRSHRLVDFVRARRRVLRRLVLVNSEGYWAEDGEFVPVNSKHSVNLGTLGILLGVLADGLKGAEEKKTRTFVLFLFSSSLLFGR